MENISPIEVQNYLKGVDYPADKQTLMNAARDNDASDEVMNALKDMLDKTYGSVQEVSKEFGKDE